MTETWSHVPVLTAEVLKIFDFGDRPARLIDGTLGNGGHSAALLTAYPRMEILGIDRDGDALARAASKLAAFGSRFTAVRGVFSAMASAAAERGWEEVEGIQVNNQQLEPDVEQQTGSK